MATTKDDVEQYLKELRFKIGMWGILIRDDRSKNAQSLHDLEIPPNQRKEIITQLTPEDYYQGPLEEKMHGILPMWVFGKVVKGKEIYIKISMGHPNSQAICISFHVAEQFIVYPFKKKKL